MKKLGIIFGGRSTENEVSKLSARSVLDNLDKSKYEIYQIFIDKDGEWFDFEKNQKIENIVEFLSNYVLISEITSYDTDLLEEVEEKKQIIELAKKHLDDNLEQLNIMKTSQERQSKILQNTKILRENYTSKLTKEEQEVQAKIDEYKTQFEQVNKEILEVGLS